MTTEYRSEYGEVTTDEAVRDGWADAGLEIDEREGPSAPWRPSNYEGEEAVTEDRIAHYAAREAALEEPRTPMDLLTVELSRNDRERLDELAAYFLAINPDLPVPSPAQLARLAIEDMHRTRVSEGAFIKLFKPDC